jgi:hypothetical protein
MLAVAALKQGAADILAIAAARRGSGCMRVNRMQVFGT